LTLAGGRRRSTSDSISLHSLALGHETDTDEVVDGPRRARTKGRRVSQAGSVTASQTHSSSSNDNTTAGAPLPKVDYKAARRQRPSALKSPLGTRPSDNGRNSGGLLQTPRETSKSVTFAMDERHKNPDYEHARARRTTIASIAETDTDEFDVHGSGLNSDDPRSPTTMSNLDGMRSPVSIWSPLDAALANESAWSPMLSPMEPDYDVARRRRLTGALTSNVSHNNAEEEDFERYFGHLEAMDAHLNDPALFAHERNGHITANGRRSSGDASIDGLVPPVSDSGSPFDLASRRRSSGNGSNNGYVPRVSDSGSPFDLASPRRGYSRFTGEKASSAGTEYVTALSYNPPSYTYIHMITAMTVRARSRSRNTV
jgi:hypothetical protein